jgi:hypothetical protein
MHGIQYLLVVEATTQFRNRKRKLRLYVKIEAVKTTPNKEYGLTSPAGMANNQ